MGFFQYRPSKDVRAPVRPLAAKVIPAANPKADITPAERKVIRLFAEIRRARRINRHRTEREAWDKLVDYLVSSAGG